MLRGVIGGGAIMQAARVLHTEYLVDRLLHKQAVERFVAQDLDGYLFINFLTGFIQRPEVYLEGLSSAAKQHHVRAGAVVLDVPLGDYARDLPKLISIAEFCRARGFALALDDVSGTAGLPKLLQEIRPALLLTATSVNGLDWECHLLQAARQLGIHSLSLLDFWSNYTRRFSLAEPLDALPQRICVMDQRAVEEMVAEGFSRSMLLITGQPALDLAAQPAAAEQLQAARTLWPQGDRRLLFVSQPLSVLHGGDAGCNQALGYNEHLVLSLVASVTEQLAGQGRRLSLRVLPHPRESAEAFSSAGYMVAQGYAAKVLAQAADIVIGMNSMLLLEAAAAG